MLQQVADGVHRYADGLVNWYMVEDDTGVLLVDTGWPDSWAAITDGLVSLGRPTRDLRGVVLTHGHPDHLGTAERIRTTLEVPVHVHAREAQRVRGQVRGASPFTLVPALVSQVWRPPALRFVLHATRHGFMRPTWVQLVSAVGDGDVLDLPGRPTVVACHGHTEGHVAYALPDRGVLLSGDALVTLDVLTREIGPRLLPDALNADPAAALTSLAALAEVEADVILPGHGEPWSGTPAEAVDQARLRARAV